MKHRNAEEDSPTVRRLLRDHGPLLPASATAKILGFNNTDALRQARLQRRLAVPMFTIPGRRGWFASTSAVAEWIDRTIDRANHGATQAHARPERGMTPTISPSVIAEAVSGPSGR